MKSPELTELIAAAKAFAPEGDLFYYDTEDGVTYRTCCGRPYFDWPHNAKGNPHEPDCPAVRLAAALAAFDDT